MKDTLTQFNSQDFNQRYRNCFGWLEKSDNEKVLVQITGVTSKQATFNTIKSTGYFVYSDQNVMFEFLPVTRGFIPTKDKVYLLTRIPARQFQRGISEGNTAIQSLNGRGLQAEGVFLPTLYSIFVEPISYEESFKAFMGKTNSAALSLNFALTKTTLYFMSRVAGSFDYKTKTITPVEIIRQEVQDLISRSPWLENLRVQ